MGLIKNPFGRKNRELKAKIAQFEFEVTNQNQMFRALYEMMSQGLALGKDSKLTSYIKEGFEGNVDLFSIILKLAGMFASIPSKLYEVQSDGKEVEAHNDEIEALMTKTNYYQNWNEFKRLWIIMYYVTGNAITYAAKYENGINAGKITKDGLIPMPTQNVTIYSENWRKVIGYYTLDIDESYKIYPVDIWHERFAPTLRFEEGANFMGMSPLKVAYNIINFQNKGYEIAAKLYQMGHPPGIVSKESEDGSETTAQQEAKFREHWRRKYTWEEDMDNISTPVFTLGKMAYTKIGFDGLRELQIVPMAEHGLRKFCNLLQCPAQLFNDMKSSTYNNQILAAKAIYTDRLIPDNIAFHSGINELLKAYGNYILKPDYSGIEALQEDKKKKMEWLGLGFDKGAYSPNEIREKLGDEVIDEPAMNTRYIPANMIPIGLEDEDGNLSNSDKFYQDNKIELEM